MPISCSFLSSCFNCKKPLTLLHFSLQVHCVWAAAEAYSAPSIVLTSHSHDGLHVFDDFREAYAWLRHNTDVDDKVSSLCGLPSKLSRLQTYFISQLWNVNLSSQSVGQEVFLDTCIFVE